MSNFLICAISIGIYFMAMGISIFGALAIFNHFNRKDL